LTNGRNADIILRDNNERQTRKKNNVEENRDNHRNGYHPRSCFVCHYGIIFYYSRIVEDELLTNGNDADIILRHNNERHNERNKMINSIKDIHNAFDNDIDIIGMKVSDSVAAEFWVYDDETIYERPIAWDGGYVRINDDKVIDLQWTHDGFHHAW
tara:strand:+ start:159 stop:626 length:468 start_codon:yes stop_codon:yes gene_type:complete